MVLMSISGALGQTQTPTVKKNAADILKEIAERSSADIAKAVVNAQAILNERKTAESNETTARTPRVLLKEQFQRDYAAAEDDVTKQRLMIEYHVKNLSLAAAEELTRQKTLPKIDTK